MCDSQQSNRSQYCTLLYDKDLLHKDRGFRFHECTMSVNINKTVLLVTFRHELRTNCVKIVRHRDNRRYSS